jgi:hypothetical protein
VDALLDPLLALDQVALHLIQLALDLLGGLQVLLA